MDDVELDYTFHELCIIILLLLIDVPLCFSLSITFGCVVAVVLMKLKAF